MTSPFKKRITISKKVSIYFYINTGCPKGFLGQADRFNITFKKNLARNLKLKYQIKIQDFSKIDKKI